MAAICPYLFVYGTLRPRSPHPMARYVEEHARLVAAAKVSGRLYHLGRYPGMTPAAAAGDWVHGEIVEMSDAEATLLELDRYEGCDDVTQEYRPFVRELAEAILAGGEKRTAWIYWYRGTVREEERILSGDYFA